MLKRCFALLLVLSMSLGMAALPAQARAQSGTMRSAAQSPPPMTLPARTVAQAGPCAKKLWKYEWAMISAHPLEAE